MQQPVVVVDANQIIERDWRLAKPLWQVVLGLAATGQITLAIHETVIKECVGHFRERLREPHRQLTKLGLPIDLDGAVSAYSAELRERLERAGVTVSHEDPITLLQLVDLAVERRPPFDAKGNGFRDAIIWAYVMKLARAHEHVVFLTNDGDFLTGKGDERVLHPDLDCAGASGVVRWFPDIGSWLSADGGDSDHDAQARLLLLIQADRDQFDSNVVAAIEEAAARVAGLPDVEVNIESASLPVDILKTTVRAIEDDDRFLVRMSVRAKAVGTVSTEFNGGRTLESAFDGAVFADLEAFLDGDQLGDLAVELVEIEAKDATSALNQRQARPFDPDQLTLLADGLAGIDSWPGEIDPEVLQRLIPKWSAKDLGIDPEMLQGLIPKWSAKDLGIDITKLSAFSELSEQLGERVRAAWASRHEDPSDGDDLDGDEASNQDDKDESADEEDEDPPHAV